MFKLRQEFPLESLNINYLIKNPIVKEYLHQINFMQCKTENELFQKKILNLIEREKSELVLKHIDWSQLSLNPYSSENIEMNSLLKYSMEFNKILEKIHKIDLLKFLKNQKVISFIFISFRC